MSKAKYYDISIVLNNKDAEAFETYCKETSCSYAGAIVCPIREHLMTEKIEPEQLVIDRDSNKTMNAIYIDEEYQLSPEEYELFDNYLKKNDYWVCEGFFEVFKLGLEVIEGRKEIIIHLDRDERISRCEGKIEAIIACIRSLTTKNEKLEEQLACLQSEVTSLQDLFLLLKKSCK